jgi:hypothetical protein
MLAHPNATIRRVRVGGFPPFVMEFPSIVGCLLACSEVLWNNSRSCWQGTVAVRSTAVPPGELWLKHEIILFSWIIDIRKQCFIVVY